jgi:hypothetical protein
MEAIMATEMGRTSYLAQGFAQLIDVCLAALHLDLGMPRSNDDFVWH